MVSLNAASRKFKGLGTFNARCSSLTVVVITALVITILNVHHSSTFNGSTPILVDTPAVNLRSSLISSSFDYQVNANLVKQWRQSLGARCQAAISKEDVNAISSLQTEGFRMPSTPLKPLHSGDAIVQKCRHVLMDFGANIGDSFGHLIDTGMKSCNRTTDLNQATLFSHFNIVTKQMELVHGRNKLTGYLERLLELQDSNRGPEDYCYYGIEGNPHFTERLQGIEDHVMAITPRPIQHMHFFTESVGAGEDGMTKLYLDTVNTEQNFWGSSIFKDHWDVKQSADGKDIETIAVPVMGYTIGKLMRMTLKAFQPDASESDKKGSHLVLKVDIEGGEYPLIEQAVADGTLCEFLKMGNAADLIIEFHGNDLFGGGTDFVGKTEKMIDALKNCGAIFHNLDAGWA